MTISCPIFLGSTSLKQTPMSSPSTLSEEFPRTHERVALPRLSSVLREQAEQLLAMAARNFDLIAPGERASVLGTLGLTFF
jgi:hypothetical protein